MAVTMQMIKDLREKTGAGVLDCKNTLTETDGDIDKAIEILRKKGLAAAAKKATRVAAQGRIDAYIHAGDKLGTLVEVNCETDFVARTDQFKTLCHDLAMQIAATSPQWVSREDVPADILEQHKQRFTEEIEPGKPEHIVDRIIEGKLAKFFRETCLVEQNFIRDEDVSIQALVTAAIAKLGENIIIKRFSRFQID